MNTTNATARFPESVYRAAGDEPVELADGSFLPPFTREIVERIAETKPEWAEFDDTYIGGDILDTHPDLYVVDWCKKFGDVDILQPARYTFDGLKVDADKPYIRVWAENEKLDSDAARTVAADLATAARELAKIQLTDAGRRVWEVRSRFLDTVTELSLVEQEHEDGSTETVSIPYPSSWEALPGRPSSGHWNPADVAAVGDSWPQVDVETGEPRDLRCRLVARVAKVDGFDDLWVEVEPVPLEGYAGELPTRA